MSLKYSMIEIFASEEARHQGQPLHEALVQYVSGLKIAARCMVIRGMEGCYENGEIATQSIVDMSFNMPILIKIILPTAQAEQILPQLETMLDEGIMAIREMNICCHSTRKRLIPRHLKVRDIMTANPETVSLGTPLSEVVKLLLSSIFTGVPVVDEHYHPAGVISQGDLIYRGGMPARLGLLSESGAESLNAVLASLTAKKAQEIMSPAVCVKEDEMLTKAVDMMLRRNLKRLPVTDTQGKLTGILSRMDIFRTITNQMPDWESIRKQNIPVGDLRYVSDIMRRDIHTVEPGTPAEEVLKLIASHDIQRVAVVNPDGIFLGLISDRNLLSAFSDRKEGIWEYLASRLPFAERKTKHTDLSTHLQSATAADLMKTGAVTVLETDTVDRAIHLMTEKMIKRLPVLDAQGKFKGMISRESLLRAGFLRS
ncbi:MAG: DUF190 domain-containing protein [Desulfobacterales bacterium]